VASGAGTCDEDLKMATKAEVARAAAEAGNPWDNPYHLGTRGYWAVQDALFDRFVATHDRCVAELQELVAGTGGPVLDGSPGSLALLDDWSRVPVKAGAGWDDGADWQPAWTGVAPDYEPWPGAMSNLQYLRLEGRVAFYFADVVISRLPGSKWVCWRDKEFNLNRTGEFLVDLGTFPTPCDPLGTAASSIRGVWRTLLDPSDPEYRPDKEVTLPGKFEFEIWLRANKLAEDGELDFQAAPTGDEAGVNRGPYKGSRIKAKIGERRGYL
jgi:hypothetical protein